MPSRIEDYALIGDCESGALVARDGSIDWLCLPRFDSGACFAALLGTPDNGRWLLQPKGDVRQVKRQYRENTLILETEFTTDGGSVTVIDFMPLRDEVPNVVRIVRGTAGAVLMRMELTLRLDYGEVCPWVRKENHGIVAVAGPDAFHVQSDVSLHGEDFRTFADFTVKQGEQASFVMTWFSSFKGMPARTDPDEALKLTDTFWRDWTDQCTSCEQYREAVIRSLITLKALTYHPTGGMVAALTTSLPERLGGSRNWDYRYCWLRDSTFTLYALIDAGYRDEAKAWRDWLLRAVAGKPENIQMIYGIQGHRRLHEQEIPWLPGYEDSRPVRIGNDAFEQLQLDVYGEVMDTLHLARRAGLSPDDNAWRIQRELVKHLETIWQQPDEGIWEVRGPRRHFTHSKIMAWVALDRAIKAVEQFGLEGPIRQWRKTRQTIHDEVCQKGYHATLNSFTQFYGTKELDAALLMIPLVGFLPPDDPRVQGTVEAIERELCQDGLVKRYLPNSQVDGLEEPEGTFLMCSFWLADNLALLGRRRDAEELFTRLLDLRNDVGLLSEEYDVRAKRFLGNFPQAFSHVALVNTVKNLFRPHGPPESRRDESEDD